MNGMARWRRASRPARVALAARLSAGIDGAWWPRTASVATELPELVGALHQRLGEIVDISINWSPTDGQRDLESVATGMRPLHVGEPRPRPRLMVVDGRVACARLLVVPNMTSRTLALLTMRTAARLPTGGDERDPRLFAMVCSVMSLAEAECARWTDSSERSPSESP